MKAFSREAPVRHQIEPIVAFAVATVGAVALIILSALVADGEVGDAERRVFDWINDLPDWLEAPAWLLQQPGVLLFPVVVGAGLWWVTRRQRIFWAFLVVAPAKLIIERLVMKQLVERERPFTSIGPGIELRGHAAEGLSYPSGHSTTAFATAVMVMAFLPRRWQWLPLLAAGIVGVARIYFGEHSPLDVVAGAILGHPGAAFQSLHPPEAVRTAGVAMMSPRVLPERRPLERSPIDLLHLVGGGAMLLVGLLIANTFDSAFVGLRHDSQSILESVPRWAANVPAALLSVSLLAGVSAVVVWAVLTRRFRRFAQLVAAVALATLASLALGQAVEQVVDPDVRAAFIIDGEMVDEPLLRLITTTDDGEQRVAPGDPLLAASVAALAVAGTWTLRRRARQLGAVLAVAALLTTLTAGVPALSLIIDIAVGVIVAATVFLVSKRHDPALLRSEVVSATAAMGIELKDLELLDVDARGSRPWIGTTTAGLRVFVKTLSRDERSADLLFRLYRWLRIRRTGDERPFISLRRAVEHEALVALQARSVGITTPTVLGVNQAGLDGMVLAFEAVEGHSLDSVSEIEDSTLRQIWQMVDVLHVHRIAHRDLRLANMMLGTDGVAHMIDFGFAEVAASDQILATDIAELLASSAAAVGPERAVAAASSVLSGDELESALPWLQPLALSGATRTAIGGDKGLEPLRAILINTCGFAAEPPVKLQRISSKTLLIMATLALSAAFLFPQLADLDALAEEVRGADPSWIAIAALLSILTYVGATASLIGAIPCPVAFNGAFQAQLASSFANRVTPAKVGGVATNIRYFQKQGVPTPVAVSAIGINGLAGLVVHVTLTTFFLLLADRSDVDTPLALPSRALLVAILGAIITLSGLTYMLPWGRRLLTTYLTPHLRTAYESTKSVAARPRKLVALFGGSALITIAYLAAFAASLEAFGSNVSFPIMAVLFLTGSAVAQAAPTPGGVGATEAALIAALSTVEAPEIVIPAVFLYRLVTYWLPILPGWLAMTQLQGSGRL